MKRISTLIILCSLLTPLFTSRILFAKARLWSIDAALTHVIGGQSVLVTIEFRGRGLAIPIVFSTNQSVVPWTGAISNNRGTIIATLLQTNEVDVLTTLEISATWDGIRRGMLLFVYPRPSDQAPSLSSPDNYAVTYSARETLSWSTVPRASSYEICITPEGSTVCNSYTTTRYQPRTSQSLGLEDYRGDLIYWKVRGLNGPGITPSGQGPWSSRRSLRVTLQSARLKSPAKNAQVNTLRPQFRWQAVEDAHEYQIEVTGPNNQKQTYAVFSGTSAFSQRRFTPPANKPLPFIGKCTWSVNARSINVTAFGEPRYARRYDEIRTMTIPLSAIKKKTFSIKKKKL